MWVGDGQKRKLLRLHSRLFKNNRVVICALSHGRSRCIIASIRRAPLCVTLLTSGGFHERKKYFVGRRDSATGGGAVVCPPRNKRILRYGQVHYADRDCDRVRLVQPTLPALF